MQRRIQVVVAEAEPDHGWLRFVLEGEGFDVVGVASNDGELDRVLRGARPSVIVLDAGISVLAARRAKRRAAEAALVVVWPDGVLAPIADACVRPGDVIDRLGEVVRAAAGAVRGPEPAIDPAEELALAIRAWRDAEPITAPVGLPRRPPASAASPRRRGRGILVLAATWILILTILATIAISVPKAIGGRDADPPPRRTAAVTTRPTVSRQI
jgi:hypothetical protein